MPLYNDTKNKQFATKKIFFLLQKKKKNFRKKKCRKKKSQHIDIPKLDDLQNKLVEKKNGKKN